MDINPGVSLPAAGGMSSDDLETLLADLEVGEADDAEVIETIENDGETITAEAGEVIEDTPAPPAAASTEIDLAELDLEIARTETYEDQDAGAADVTVEAITETPAPAAGKPAKAPKERKASSGPAVHRDLSTLAAEAFVLSSGETPADLEANKTAVLATRPVQKKIAEKFDNAIAALHAGRKPSTFVIDAYKVLKAKGSMTSTDLVAALKAEDYSEGTARSQAGQIMQLFPVLKIATRSGSSLTTNPDSALGAKLDALLGA